MDGDGGSGIEKDKPLILNPKGQRSGVNSSSSGCLQLPIEILAIDEAPAKKIPIKPSFQVLTGGKQIAHGRALGVFWSMHITGSFHNLNPYEKNISSNQHSSARSNGTV